MANKAWTGTTSGVYDTDSNWVASGVPNNGDTALFGSIASRKTISILGSNSVQGWTISADGYSFALAANRAVIFNGAGITGVSSGHAKLTLGQGSAADFFHSSSAGSMLFEGDGTVNFADTSSAEDASLRTHGDVVFTDQSSAGTASFDLSILQSMVRFRDTSTAANSYFSGQNGTALFADNSTAGTAEFESYGGNINFFGSSNAGSAFIESTNFVVFDDNSSASSAVLDTHTLEFQGNSSAASAQIQNDSTLYFIDHATGGNATIVANGSVTFRDNANPGSAVLSVFDQADMDDSTGPNGDHRLSVGALSGDGTLKLGNNELTIGSRNRTTIFSGSITDGNPGGASIVKVGSGVLALTGTSNYSGGSTVNGGALQIDGTVLGTAVVNSGASLAGIGTIKGAVAVNSGALLSPGHTFVLAGNDTKGALKVGGLALNTGSKFALEIGGIVAGVQHDIVVVTGGVTIDQATLNTELTDAFAPSLKVRQNFLIIENDGSDAIIGRFAGLSEGATFFRSNRVFSISYAGGTGNDVVLTSEGALIKGTTAADTVSVSKSPIGEFKATPLKDLIFTFGGKDQINAGKGDDTAQGGAGKDTIDGGRGSDTANYFDKTKSVVVTLNGSHDVGVKINGKIEDRLKNVENLVGGNAADRFAGDSKDNHFDGGLGKDVFKGAGGKDHFVFSVAPGKANADTIVDFNHKTDKIALDDSVFEGLGEAIDSAEFFAKAGAHKAHDADDRIVYNKTNGNLYYDADGFGGTKAMLFATLTTHPGHFAHGDFLVV